MGSSRYCSFVKTDMKTSGSVQLQGKEGMIPKESRKPETGGPE